MRSVSPPPRRAAPEQAETVAESTVREHEDAEGTLPTRDEAVLSIRAAVREYEAVHDELKQVNRRARELRGKASTLRTSLEDFMRSRKLERLGTRDGRLTVKIAQETTRVRPSKKETVRCVVETLGDDHSELAEELLRKLYEEKKEVRSTTRLLKHE